MIETGPHLNNSSNPPEFLLPEESLGYYERSEIDRDFGTINGDFQRVLGEGGNPYLLATTKLKTDGHVTIMDAGCGTGYALFELADGLQHRYGESAVSVLAVNGEDFSRESQFTDVRRAYRTAHFPYVVAEIGALPVQDDSVDLIYSYEVFQHNEEKGEMLCDLARVLSPGGTLVFNTDPTTPGDTHLQTALRVLMSEGFAISKGTAERGSKIRDFYSVTKPNKKGQAV